MKRLALVLLAFGYLGTANADLIIFTSTDTVKAVDARKQAEQNLFDQINGAIQVAVAKGEFITAVPVAMPIGMELKQKIEKTYTDLGYNVEWSGKETDQVLNLVITW